MPSYTVRAQFTSEQAQALIHALAGYKIDAHIVSDGVGIYPRNDTQAEAMQEICTEFEVPEPVEEKEVGAELDQEQNNGMFGMGGLR